MHLLYPVFFLLLIVGPILLAWLKGNQILNAFIAYRQRRRQQRRRRSTRALPVRDEVLQALLGAEKQRDRADGRIGEALAAFQRLSEASMPPQNSTAALSEVESILLTRESRFNTYLDVAWLQSETIELLVQEVELLREMAGIPSNFPENEAQSPAAERLIQNLNRATNRRAEVDRRLDRIGSPNPKAGPGSHFEATVK